MSYERHASFTSRRSPGSHQPATELAFTVPQGQAYDRDDDDDDVIVHSGGLAAQDSNAHYAVHIQDLEDGRGRGYNRSISFADHPPGTLVGDFSCSSHPPPHCLLFIAGVKHCAALSLLTFHHIHSSHTSVRTLTDAQLAQPFRRSLSACRGLHTHTHTSAYIAVCTVLL